MAWELLPVDYTDAVWAGLKRYNQINNEDGSVSFQDITSYTGKEKSFFGAKDANRMNEALNTIMSMVENVASAPYFSIVLSGGDANYAYASVSFGVRPAFCIG